MISGRAIVYLGAFRLANTGPDAVVEIFDHWQKQPPRFILGIPDHSSTAGYPDSATCPPAVLEALVKGTEGCHLAAFFETPLLFPWVYRPAPDYPTVNSPIHIYEHAQNALEPR